MVFSMHYTIEVDPERRVIQEKIYGTWKKETAESYHEEYMRVAAPLVGSRWAKVVNLTNWKSSYPEIIKVVGEHLRWCRENGMIISINIIDNPITKNQLKRMFAIGSTAKISRIVRSREDAEKVLVENGF